MTQYNPEIFLPVLMLIFLVIFLIWNISFQHKILKRKKNLLLLFTRMNHFFQILLGLAALIVGLYAFIPNLYFLLIPLDSLNKPLINDAGSMILQVAFLWLLSSMLQFLFLSIKMPDKQRTGEMYVYIQKTVLTSVVLLLLGLALAISNLGTCMLCLVGLYIYYQFYNQAKSY